MSNQSLVSVPYTSPPIFLMAQKKSAPSRKQITRTNEDPIYAEREHHFRMASK